MRLLLRALLPLLAMAAVLGACGGDDGGDDVVAGDPGTSTTVGPDTAVSSPPGTDDGTPPGTTWTRIEPTEDLVNPTVVTPEEVVADPADPNAVLIRFYGGVQECYGARASVVEDTPQRVVIRLEQGGRPDAGDRACIEIAEAQELQLVLDAPVGDRELVADAPR